MPYQPRWDYTHQIVTDLLVVEAAREFAEFVPIPSVADLVLRQRTRVRSTHASTAIEGNPILCQDVAAAVLTPQATAGQVEIRNYWRALEWLEERVESGEPLTESTDEWRSEGLVLAAAGEARVRRWKLADPLQQILREALAAGIAEPVQAE